MAAELPASVPGHRDAKPAADGSVSLRLPFRFPLCPDNLFGHLAATAVPGVEEWRDGAYRRTLRLPGGGAVVALRPRSDHIECRLTLGGTGGTSGTGGAGGTGGTGSTGDTGDTGDTGETGDTGDLAVAIGLCRRLLDLDADPGVIDERLSADPRLAPLVAGAPGRRVPGTVDPAEFAVRAVLGQQVSTAAARTHAARLVIAHGERIDDPGGGLTHLFPTPAALTGLDPASLALPRARRRTLSMLVDALASREIELSPGTDLAEARRRLMALPGFGPWTVETIAMRALGDPDAFVAGDLGVVRAAEHVGLPSTPAALTAASQAWRPWRAYAVQHLWATGDHAINRLPDDQASVRNSPPPRARGR